MATRKRSTKKAEVTVEETQGTEISEDTVVEDTVAEGVQESVSYTTYLVAKPACHACHKEMSGPMGAIDSHTYQCLNSECEVFKRGYALKIESMPEVKMVEAFKM